MHYDVKVEEKNGYLSDTQLVIDCCVAAGYTGRDQEAVRTHIEELQKLGVATPYSIPAMYWISPGRISNYEVIYVVGDQSSPEVEFFMAWDKSGNTYFTVASDHTDRGLEAVSVSKSKQVCDKVLGDVFWRLEDVDDQWSGIKICSKVYKDDTWHEYQCGTLGDIMHHTELTERVQKEISTGQNPAIFSGTLPVIGGEMIYTSRCEIIMHDPHMERKIVKEYQIINLPDRS